MIKCEIIGSIWKCKLQCKQRCRGRVRLENGVVKILIDCNIIRGLLSAHVLAELVQSKQQGLLWYRGELLNMAVDCATRLLPAFNSSTGDV